MLKYGTLYLCNVCAIVSLNLLCYIFKTTLNQVTITPPYEVDGLRFESSDAKVYIHIEEIRSYMFLSVWNTLQINLAMEHFVNNTQGQCGK